MFSSRSIQISPSKSCELRLTWFVYYRKLDICDKYDVYFCLAIMSHDITIYLLHYTFSGRFTVDNQYAAYMQRIILHEFWD